MIETIAFNDSKYPMFQTKGHASQFAIPFAKHVCRGIGLDIGCMKEEWAFPGAKAIDKDFEDEWDAYNIPREYNNCDYIFSSHCLEHLPNWVTALDYWYENLKTNGVLFLYFPHFSQQYWRPWHNRKHVHCFNGDEIESYMKDKGYINIFRSGVDLNNSFIIMCEKI